MAGITDLPFRQLCRRLGADYAVSEMITAREELWTTDKTRQRLELEGADAPRVVQLAGTEPPLLAAAAERAVAAGADVIDLNMGCPAKKVCQQLAGSALLRDEALVARILRAVRAAVRVPVTLKMRTGWSPSERNGVAIARIAEDCGIDALAVHGRTRACAFSGSAEYATVAAIKAAVRIPVLANGDITTPAKALAVLAATGADGLLIGRGAQGDPWLFGAIKAALAGRAAPLVEWPEIRTVAGAHVAALHAHYGPSSGVRIVRKHVGWYFARAGLPALARSSFLRLEAPAAQLEFIAGLEHAPRYEAAA